PLSDKAKQDLITLRRGVDYFHGLSSDEKKAKLARISYANYLTEVAHADPQIVKLYQNAPQALFGLGIAAISAQDAWGFDFLGCRGLKLGPGPCKGMYRDVIPSEEAEKYFYHFPDGNASIARSLVRRLVPGVLPGNSIDDLITTKANYAKLDAESSAVRI